jgi:hypothetical protein
VTLPPDSRFEMSAIGDVDPEVQEHLLPVRTAFLQGPPPETASAHLAAVTDAARLLAPAQARPTRRGAGGRERVMTRMRRIAVGVAVAAMAGVVSMAGLAFASGSLPATAVTAMTKHGISLPPQATTTHSSSASLPDASQHGQDVRAVATDGTTGCQHGQEVAAVASSKRQDSHAASTRQDAANRPDPCTQGGSSSSGAPSGTTTGSPGYGKDNHPTGNPPTTAGTNPTGYGKDNHPTGGGSGQANNPTGYGKGNHPGR